MSNYQTDVTKLVARCQRIGWRVEKASSAGTDWWYRINCPDGTRVQIHNTPKSGAGAIKAIMGSLNGHGFAEAETAWLEASQAAKDERLQAERKKADAQAELMAKRAAALAKAAGPLAGPQPVDPAWLMTPTKKRESRVVLIDAPVAKAVLETMNNRNRRPSAARVTYFENLINDQEFGCTHQGGAIDWDGNLQDGQSRLQAIANLDAVVEMEWTVGLDPANFSRVDTGGVRNAEHTAYIMGEEDPRTSSTAAKMLLMIDRHGPDAHMKAGKGRVSNDTVEKCIALYGDPLRQAITLAREIKKDVRKANVSALACAIYLIRQRLPEDDARVAEFFEQVQDGNVDKGDVVWKLRQALLNGTNNRAYTAWVALALIIKAWNFRHTGRRVIVLTWKPNEPFPCHVFLPPPPVTNEAGTTETADGTEAA